MLGNTNENRLTRLRKNGLEIHSPEMHEKLGTNTQQKLP